jgi:hypothetical protein
MFRFQAVHNQIYRAFIDALSIDTRTVEKVEMIPFFPISLFKQHQVVTGTWSAEKVFTSSGTTAGQTSRHFVKSLRYYLDNAKRSFEHFFGNLTDYNFLALLPSYLERSGSSLVSMMDFFIKESRSPWSAFYLHDVDKLITDLQEARTNGRKTILWGVTFALLDLAEKYQVDLGDVMIMDTGGMKGRNREVTRQVFLETMKAAFQVDQVFSEYGMTELMSQAYSKNPPRLACPPWMRVIGRELTDPMEKGLLRRTAGINVVDLANVHAVAFIETEDLGVVYEDGSFEVQGRIDNSDLRGCNLLLD